MWLWDELPSLGRASSLTMAHGKNPLAREPQPEFSRDGVVG